ncbi:hypothetical protein LL946_04615 [Knoellia locipacati]|uniref:phospholipase D-like domain-containing protein DpdK n=1 Tax=Knoellia locipacati TaxID=882824 RepID=UPI00384F92BE
MAIVDVLAGVIASELCSPSPELWLVSGWVSDVTVLDNSSRQFDGLMGQDAGSSLTLSEVLQILATKGTEVHVALRDVEHNRDFLRRLGSSPRIHTYLSADLHEKILVGWDWTLKGSMNFTWNGLRRNEESIDLQVGPAVASTQRLELRTRWMGGAG